MAFRGGCKSDADPTDFNRGVVFNKGCCTMNFLSAGFYGGKWLRFYYNFVDGLYRNGGVIFFNGR